MRNSTLPLLVKVGKAVDVAKRAKDLGQSHPFVIEICHEYAGYGFLELIIHDRLREHRVAGGSGREWFEMHAEQVNAIIRDAIAEWHLTRP